MADLLKNNPKIRLMNPSTLQPYSRNSKVHTKAQILKIANSIAKFGFVQPIVVDKDLVIAIGHGRREAAIQLNMKEVPVLVADHLTDDEVTALRITDNRIADAPWDADLLKFELTTLNMHEFDLDVLGFEMPELDKFLNDGEIGPELFGGSKVATGNEDKVEVLPVTHVEENANDADVVPEVAKFDFVKPGDIWTLGRHRLMCGDSTSKEYVAKLMAGAKADMTFTSPPYNAGISAKLRGNTSVDDNFYGDGYDDNKDQFDWLKFVTKCTNISLDYSRYVFWNIQFLAGNKNALPVYWNSFSKQICDVAIWDKGHAAPQQAARVLNSVFEFIFIFTSDENPTRSIRISPEFRGNVDNIFRIPPQRNNEFANVHAATFPVIFPETFITKFCPKKGSVIDLFGGTGSTLIACEKTDRTCFMMELDPHYCAVILRRWAEYTGNDPVRESDGALLSDLLIDQS